jgi:hypothetical protein
MFPETRQRMHRYNHIANTVPPEFVTKLGYRHAHSLTHAAFECIDDKYQQLQVTQELARLDVQALLDDIDLYTQAREQASEPELYNIDPLCSVVATICALIAMVGCNGDTGALTDGLNIHMPVAANSSSGSKMAYNWVQTNWSMIQTLSSKNLPLPRVVPHYSNTQQWTVCLQRVVREHVGLNWRQRKHRTQFEITPLSMWAKLGINVSKYIEWYCSPHAEQFGIIQKSIECCTECDGAGDDVDCVRQNNTWRCTSRSSQDFWRHRRLFDPLDVNAAWIITTVPPPEEVAEEEEEQKQLEHKVRSSLIDRFLGHIGFQSPVVVGTCTVSKREMKLAWLAASVSQEDIEAMFLLCAVNLKPLLANKTDTKNLLLHAATILQTADIQLDLRRQRSGNKQYRKYHLTYVSETMQ